MTSLKKLLPDLLKKADARKDAKLYSEFLPDAMEIVESPPSPLGHLVLGIVAAVFLSAVVFACVGEVDEVATARGKVVAANRLQQVQTAREGKIEEIYVEEGETVTAGQQLIKLDSLIQNLQYSNTQNTLSVLEAQNTLFEGFLAGEDISVYFYSLESDNERKVYEYIDALQKEYIGKQEQLAIQIATQNEALSIQQENQRKTESNLVVLQQQKELLEQMGSSVQPDEQLLSQYEAAIGVARREESDYYELYKAGVISKAEWRTKADQLKNLENQHNVQNAQVEYNRQQKELQLQELDGEISLAQSDCAISVQNVEQAGRQLERSQKELDLLNAEMEKTIKSTVADNGVQIKSLENEITGLKSELETSVLCSPVDGVVQSLEVNTIGGTVTPAQVLVTIAPSTAEVIVEGLLPNKEAGFVSVGQPVSVKMDAYPFQQYGMAEGKVLFISPDSELNELMQLNYKIKVALNGYSLQGGGEKKEILPGMEGTVEIKIGKRKIISFFLDPFVKNLDESFKLR